MGDERAVSIAAGIVRGYLGIVLKPESFYARVLRAAEQAPQQRHVELLTLHREVMDDYVGAVECITSQAAAQPVNMGADRRTLGQIVGHFVGWDRFSILAAGDILAGVELPRTVIDQRGFIDTDGRVYDFESVDAFNDWHAERDSQLPWATIQANALETAGIFYALFADPALLNADRLERTPMHEKRLYDGTVIHDIRMGWALWLIELQHYAVEHATELNLST